MNPTVKAQWLEALRSGSLQQGEGWLQRGDAYCCLGVLCEVAVQAMVIAPARDVDGVMHYETKSTSLPDLVFNWAGLPEGNQWSSASDNFKLHVQDKLIELNDVDGASFDEIADWIEENL